MGRYGGTIGRCRPMSESLAVKELDIVDRGQMAADGRVLVITAWWVSLVPGLSILFTVLSMDLQGDLVRDKPDSRLRKV